MDYFRIHESSPVTMGPTLKRRKSQEGMYSFDKNRRSQSRAKELFNVILTAGLLNGKGTSKGFICKISLDFFPNTFEQDGFLQDNKTDV